jgi:hypothetical protein
MGSTDRSVGIAALSARLASRGVGQPAGDMRGCGCRKLVGTAELRRCGRGDHRVIDLRNCAIRPNRRVAHAVGSSLAGGLRDRSVSRHSRLCDGLVRRTSASSGWDGWHRDEFDHVSRNPCSACPASFRHPQADPLPRNTDDDEALTPSNLPGPGSCVEARPIARYASTLLRARAVG